MNASLKRFLQITILPLAMGLTGCYATNAQTALIAPMPSLTPAASPTTTVKHHDLPNDESAKVCFATAEALEQGGKNAEAIALYERARQLDNHFAIPATRKLAALYDRTGDFDRALVEYRRGLTENPKDAELLNDLGYGYYCRAEWAEAEKNLRKAVAANPKVQSAWVNLGMTLAQMNRYDESLTAFGKVVTPAQARCNLAFIQFTQGKMEEAKQNYESALKLEPGLQIARVALQKMSNSNLRVRTASDLPPLANAAPNALSASRPSDGRLVR
jgi:tetratricopeptide (TPR) repeat protein